MSSPLVSWRLIQKFGYKLSYSTHYICCLFIIKWTWHLQSQDICYSVFFWVNFPTRCTYKSKIKLHVWVPSLKQTEANCPFFWRKFLSDLDSQISVALLQTDSSVPFPSCIPILQESNFPQAQVTRCFKLSPLYEELQNSPSVNKEVA